MCLIDVAQQSSTVEIVFFQKFYKTVRVLKVNEAKFAPRNAFIDNVLGLKSERCKK